MNRLAGGAALYPAAVFSRRVLAALILAVLAHAWLLFGLERARPEVTEAETEGAPGIEISLNFAPPAPPESGAATLGGPEIIPEPEPLPVPETAPAKAPAQPVSPPVASGAAQADSVPITAQEEAVDNAAVRVEAATPRRHDNAKPVYPELARRRGQEGAVMLEVSLDAAGQPLQIAVAQSSGHQLLDDAAVRAVQKWRFNPARRGGVAVPGQVRVPVVFRLTD